MFKALEICLDRIKCEEFPNEYHLHGIEGGSITYHQFFPFGLHNGKNFHQQTIHDFQIYPFYRVFPNLSFHTAL